MAHSAYLLAAWIAWAASSTSVLMSFLTSQLAMRKAIRQPIAKQTALQRRRLAGFGLLVLNIAGLTLFLLGLAMIVVFLNYNLHARNERTNHHKHPTS